MPVTLPTDTQREAIIGRTGSGKTLNGVYQLSQRSWDKMPWIIIDFKRDPSISLIPTVEMDISDPLPDLPGLYIIHPMPDQKAELHDFFMRVWEHENIGIFVDEAYMIGQHNAGYRTILTQGRSKHIPVITLSQRPVAVDTFTFSEADYIQVFELSMRRDRKTVEENTPLTMDELDEPLPEFHSFYYDVKKNQVHRLGPSPDMPAIIKIFESRLREIHRANEPTALPQYRLYRI